jgi:septation ring formation regulator
MNLNEINDLILEADFCIDQKDFPSFFSKKTKTEIRLCEALEKKERIFSQIQEITTSEEKNRTIVTELKSRFREIMQTFESSKADFNEYKEIVELQIENMEKRFQNFEDCMENQEFEEIPAIVNSLDTLIQHMETIMEEMPSIILLADNLIPKRMEEINFNYKKLEKEGYQLDYLNIDYNISEIEKKLENIKSKIRVLDLEDVLFELKTILEYFDSVFNDFEIEKLARKSFEEQIISFKSKASKIHEVINNLYGKVADAKYNYTVSNEKIESLDILTDEVQVINKDFDILYETTKTASFPYTRLVKELELLIMKLSSVEEKLERYTQTVGNMQDDEKRAREQFDDISELLKNSKYKIREYKFPVIPNSYFVELDEAKEAIREITRELDKKPINIEVLNTRVDTARDLVFKFYNTSNELIKTAMMAENSIVYGNRYKSNKTYIEEGLNKSTMLFSKGEYKKALELALNTIDMVEPGIHKKLLGLYEKDGV